MFKKIIFGAAIALGLTLVLVFVIGTKKRQFDAMKAAGQQRAPRTESVATFIATQQTWPEQLHAVGSIEPIQGVRLDAEMGGVVRAINFANGQQVDAGEVLVQLDVAVEQAQLRAHEATARLAEVEFKRATTLRESGNVPQSQLDRARADLEKADAEVHNLKAIIERKTIRAPFSGRVGIRQINLGQYVAQGAPIVTLQSYQQVFVNFTLPQQALARLSPDLPLTLRSDVYPEQIFDGRLTAISPEIDPITRTVQLQGTLDNPQGRLRAGLFVKVTLTLPDDNPVLVVPATAIVYAPYGNTIYKVDTQPDPAANSARTVAQQSFIRIGKRRGDFVSVLEGVEAGDEVIAAGAFKLRNGAPIQINNDLTPTPELAPDPKDS
jgi:membrane fusion protein (multidrug efflux system)